MNTVLVRIIQIFNFYGLCQIGCGYIDYFLICIKDLYGFINGPWLPKIRVNLCKSVKICKNLT